MKNVLVIIALCFSGSLVAQTEATHDKAKMEASMKQSATTKTKSEPLKENGIDPVCKMKVAKGTALTTTYKGKQIGFCGDYCKEKFEEKPDKYVPK